jgi:hypothetical protein
MTRIGLFIAALAVVASSFAQGQNGTDFDVALPDHPGQLRWSAEGFKVIESSAKSNGRCLTPRQTTRSLLTGTIKSFGHSWRGYAQSSPFTTEDTGSQSSCHA